MEEAATNIKKNLYIVIMSLHIKNPWFYPRAFKFKA